MLSSPETIHCNIKERQFEKDHVIFDSSYLTFCKRKNRNRKKINGWKGLDVRTECAECLALRAVTDSAWCGGNGGLMTFPIWQKP